MTKKIVVTMLVLLASLAAWAKRSDIETRTHYQIVDRSHVPLYTATVIKTNSESLNTETYLLENTAGERVRIDIKNNYAAHRTTAEYSVNDGPPARVTLDMPYKSTTRSGMIEEARTRQDLLTADVPVTVEAHGRSLKTSEKQWVSATDRRTLHEKARNVVGADLAAVLANLRSVLAFPDLMGACSTLSFVAGGEKCVARTDLRIAVVRPDCDFDSKFGVPCDATQKGRAKEQPRNGRVGPY